MKHFKRGSKKDFALDVVEAHKIMFGHKPKAVKVDGITTNYTKETFNRTMRRKKRK